MLPLLPSPPTDPTAQMFLKVLLLELQKVSTFYVDKAAELEVRFVWQLPPALTYLSASPP